MIKKIQISQKNPDDEYFDTGIELEIDESSFGSLLDTLSVMQRCTPAGYTLRIDIADINNDKEGEKDV